MFADNKELMLTQSEEELGHYETSVSMLIMQWINLFSTMNEFLIKIQIKVKNSKTLMIIRKNQSRPVLICETMQSHISIKNKHFPILVQLTG